jgi:hypothetical protein
MSFHAFLFNVQQESLDLGIISSNINPTMTSPLPSEGTSTMVMPPILGQYTSLLFEVQQSSAGLSSSTEMQFDGAVMGNTRMNLS